LKLEVRVQPGDALERYLRFSAPARSVEKANETADPAPAASPPLHDGSVLEPRTVVPVTLGSLAAISGGVALAFSIKGSAANAAATDWALRTGGNCDVLTPACSGLADARQRRNDANQIANVAWVGAGTFALATLATVFFWPKASSPVAKANLRFVPRAGNDMRGVLVMGSF
jgi:hypothetical protein